MVSLKTILLTILVNRNKTFGAKKGITVMRQEISPYQSARQFLASVNHFEGIGILKAFLMKR